MQRMVASSIPNNTVPTSTCAQSRAGEWIASFDFNVASTRTPALPAIASTNESLHDSSTTTSTLTGPFCCNQQYSVTAVTTSTRAIAERYAYTAYGQPTILNASGLPLTPQSSTLSNRYSFTGREWDSTLGLHHFRARWMNPSAGRFLGRDPIGYEGSEWGLYEFLHAGVMVGMDPMGLEGFPYIRTCGDKLIHKYPGYKEEDCPCVPGPTPPKKNPPKVGVTIPVPLGAAREIVCGESTKNPVTIDLLAEAQAAIGIPPFVVTVKGSVKASQTFSLDCELPECPKKCCDGPPPCDGVKKCQLMAYFRVLAVGTNIILLDVPTVKTVTCMTGTCDCSTKGGPWHPVFGPNHPYHPNNQP
jgi:RHS repeat-associated protein